ncbi:50S ribosome-binding GTPase [Rhizoctonia solani]|uniref:50S ribosome-binding GTPase n=1 Tax=Rhizoctonia solani TaxID=456999 RepID=A0A8H7M4P7_9AGAM|nr:50S ribosome-binding GTPase [Rhizoctonia solani]
MKIMNTDAMNTDAPKLIALFGATGTGKTTFINDASGENLEVGDDLESCTHEVAPTQVFRIDGQDVVLIDTPGFDDTELSDTEILKRITAFLTSSYKNGYKLTGIIYLHRITDVRVGGISRRTFQILRGLCGQETLTNVLIVTNMWSDPPTAKEIQNEKQLRDNSKFFQPAIGAGARMVRRPYKDTRSALDIIQLAKMEQKYIKEMEEVKEELRQAKEQNNTQALSELQDFLAQSIAESARLSREIQSLREGFEEERLRWESRVTNAERVRSDAEKRQQEMELELKELQSRADRASGEELRRLERMINEILKKIETLKAYKQSCVIIDYGATNGFPQPISNPAGLNTSIFLVPQFEKHQFSSQQMSTMDTGLGMSNLELIWNELEELSLTNYSDATSKSPSDEPGSIDHGTLVVNSKLLEYARDYGPKVVWPPAADAFDPEGIMPLAQQSTGVPRIIDDPIFQDVRDFFEKFLTRFFYNYATIHENLHVRIRRRFGASMSLKYGMLGMAALFRSNYEHSYFDGILSSYYAHLNQAASVVRLALGSNTIDILKLSGEQTFDLRCIAWADILSSMALARPTLLNYESDIHKPTSIRRLW